MPDSSRNDEARDHEVPGFVVAPPVGLQPSGGLSGVDDESQLGLRGEGRMFRQDPHGVPEGT